MHCFSAHRIIKRLRPIVSEHETACVRLGSFFGGKGQGLLSSACTFHRTPRATLGSHPPCSAHPAQGSSPYRKVVGRRAREWCPPRPLFRNLGFSLPGMLLSFSAAGSPPRPLATACARTWHAPSLFLPHSPTLYKSGPIPFTRGTPSPAEFCFGFFGWCSSPFRLGESRAAEMRAQGGCACHRLALPQTSH